MRWNMLSGMLLLAPAALALGADDVQYSARVVTQGTEVRSGPSDKFYPTERVAAGEVVQVVEDRGDGWLAIKPPSKAFSWVNARFIKEIGRNTGMVVAHADSEVPVFYGSTLLNQAPSIKSTVLSRGSQVVLIAPARNAGTEIGQLYPIEPPPNERRYVLKNAVQRVGGPVGAVVSASPPTGLPVSQPRATTDPDPRWLRAQELERSGQFQEAIRIYKDLADAVAKTDYPLSVQALNRVAFLSDGNRAAPVGESFTNPAGTRSPFMAIPGSSGPVQAQLVPRSAEETGHSTTNAALASQTQQSVVGHLRRAFRCIDLRQAYALEDTQGRTVTYINPGAGLNLDPYVNSNVEVVGSMVYRGDLRANYMVATSMRPLR